MDPQAGVELLSKEERLPVPRASQRETSFQVYTTFHLFFRSFYPESSQEQEVIFQGLLWRQGVRTRLKQRSEAATLLFNIQCLLIEVFLYAWREDLTQPQTL